MKRIIGDMVSSVKKNKNSLFSNFWNNLKSTCKMLAVLLVSISPSFGWHLFSKAIRLLIPQIFALCPLVWKERITNYARYYKRIWTSNDYCSCYWSDVDFGLDTDWQLSKQCCGKSIFTVTDVFLHKKCTLRGKYGRTDAFFR